MYLATEESTPGGYGRSAAEGLALDELDRVYSFIFGRVGNRADAEDLTQQVALKALHRLREGSQLPEIRGYLFAAARSVLAAFWAEWYRLPAAQLADDLADTGASREILAPKEACEWLEAVLARLPAHYRKVLELRFLNGCSIKEAAREMGRSEGAVKVMQLRALRAAAASQTR